MDEHAVDKIIFDNDATEYCLGQGYDNFINGLLKYFPDEKEGIQNYCDKIREICLKFPLYNLRPGGGFNDKADVLEIDAKTFIDSVTSNERLREVLAGNNALYAGIPDRTPLYVHALVINSYIESSWKCVDGGSQISKALLQVIRSNNGELIRNAEVTRLVEEDGIIKYAMLADGRKMLAKNYISNIHPARTLQITETEILKKAYVNRISSLENSCSSFTLNLSFKKNSFRYFMYNYYYIKSGFVWKGHEYTEENWPLGYALFMAPSSRSPEYADGVSILTYMRYEDVAQWADTKNTVAMKSSRGVSYDEFKKKKAEKLIEEVEKKFPGIRDCILNYYTATPLSYRDYIGTSDGSLYGVIKDYKNPLKTFLSPKTKIPNLFFTGQNLNLHGILGTSMSALVTCSSFLGDDLVMKIKNA
jgi:all-trans-retinol 13,14-reductase